MIINWYFFCLNIKEEGNLSKVKLNFRSDLGSSNTTLFFCLPKISRLNRFLLAFIDITKREPYETLSPFLVDIDISQSRFSKLQAHIKDFIQTFGETIDEQNSIVYFTVKEEDVEELGGFAYYLPKINRWKLLLAIFRYIGALFIGALIAHILNSFLS